LNDTGVLHIAFRYPLQHTLSFASCLPSRIRSASEYLYTILHF